MSTADDVLKKQAIEVLDRNRMGNYTCPSKKLYPHQWSWDSAFIAMGLATFNQSRAQQELWSLFKGQWNDGRIPHIIFHYPDREYFPGAEFWQSSCSEEAPAHLFTSGIIQPPVHATSVLSIYKYARDTSLARTFLSVLFPRLKAWHHYLHSKRDPNDEGLVYICHPWESGRDNSPLWDFPLENIAGNTDEIPSYERVDNTVINPSERPEDTDYDRYIYLANIFKNCRYEDYFMLAQSPFVVHDVLFNSLWCQANRDLAEIARIIGEDPEPFQGWAGQTAQAVNGKLWDPGHGIYIDYDLVNRQHLDVHVASGFTPLFAGIPDEPKKEAMLDYLNSTCFCRLGDDCYALPSYDKCGPGYAPRKYWRGPVWININWLIYKGLVRNGLNKYARWVRRSILQLPGKFGFHEYFEPELGKGLGASNFSWTAALVLDTLYDEELK